MELPEDAMFEILLRLPVLALLRFKCVCKKLCAIINSPLFKDIYLAYQLASDNDQLILVKRRYHWGHHHIGKYKNVVNCYGDYESLARWKKSYGIDSGPCWLSFLTYISGIVCVTNFEDFNVNIILFNPALREFRKIAEFSPLPTFIHGSKIRAVGLGFDDSSNDYMLVELVSFCERDDVIELKCGVYNVKTDSWRMIKIPPFVSASYFKDDLICSSFFSHGSIHWCIGWKPNYRILTFNVTSKLFQEIQFPNSWKDYRYEDNSHLFKVDNSCIALVADHGTYEKTFDVWMMKEYGVTDSWTKKYSIGFLSVIKPLSFWRKDKLLFQASDGKIVCYDLSKGQVCEPRQRDSIFVSYSDLGSLEVVTCYESLVSINQS